MSSGFDLYQATRSFKALDTTSDLKIQQDLMVNGSLSLMGAAVGIGTAISFALGGTAATVAGPVGLIVGAGIILGGEIYSSVRQIENIGQYVHLTPMETLHNGWRVFTGQGADPEIENRVAYIKTRETVRQQYSRLLVEQSQKILQSNGQINILYTSLGEVEVEGHPYKKIVAKDLAGREHVIRDHILPSEDIQAMISRALTEYLGQYSLGQHPLILDKPRVVPSEYHYYTPKRLLHTDDTINNSELSINVVMTTFSAQSQRVGQFIDQDGASLNKHMEANYHSVMGDFNGDGRRDIGYFTAQRLYLLLSNINGSYTEAPPIDYNSGEVPTTARYLIGDINNDDRDDIILIMDDEERIDILFIQEGGGFVRQHIAIQDEGEIRVSAPLQATPVLADINGDGYADWVSFTRSDVNINYGGSEGTFSTGISASLAALHKGDASQYIHHMTGDIDGDSCDDIVSLTKNGRLHILLGVNKNQRRVPFKKGSEQSYASVTALLADFNPEQIQLADIDGDGRADLVVIQNDGRYTLCHGRQNGRFGPVTDDTQREERGQRVAYRPNRLAVRGEQQILGITLDRDDKPALFSLNQAGIVFTHTLSAIPIQETITDVRLGGGNDVVKGNQDQKYSFEMEEGTKNFSGGRYADRFLLMGKPAPHQPSVLDGGEDPTSTDQHDTVIAVARPAENDGYIINLNTGTVSYTSNHKKIIANLLHIEHAQGHSETNDILRGNEDDNLLNGVGGKDSLFGEGGNDILMLQAGIALGGTGTDSYRILQNNRPENAMVTVFEAPDTQEISNVLLDYTAEQIVSVSHKEGFVLLTLRNDNSTLTTLGLYGMYSDPKEDPLTHQPGAYHTLADKPFSSNAFTDKSARKKRSRQHNFLLYTRDGFMISGWPQQLMPPSDDSEPLLPRLAARYKPEWDRNWQKLTQRSKPADIQVHLSTQNEQGKITINIAGREVRANLLPSFMQLIIAETPFNDRLEGDDTNNRLQSAQGNDILIGKGGSDHYVIEHKKPGRQITINNYDDTIGDLLPQDTLALPLSIKDIHLQQEANDIILSYRDMPTLYPTVRITNFMQDVRYRHISVQDENDTLLPLVRNNAGNLSLGRLEITAGDDVAIVYHESALLNALVNDQLNLLAGDDIFIDLTNNSNYTLIGGKGNDTLLGGGGDNTYLIAQDDGHDIIEERGGHNSLKFTSANINKKTLWLKQQNNDLIILINGANNSVTIKNYYDQSESKIDKIEAGGFQLAGSNIDQMVLAMSIFSSANSHYLQSLFSWHHEELQNKFNTLWREAVH
ncbi:hypothetical protein CCS41_06415 [Candidatus Fukatsuia symbiotica]|uniref:Haemolysin-type calcium binding-related domain-containing protein n=2 Tax=Yersiniaceae TaxID=1903411 RepID=A0A2U8I4V8_9GAMM|nr:FG-GAP-like repeat-containing protein [Candidatus Fukatsuia symbiotica]AWK14196.1 hypothetical protein CCS41_06415 [Candidatus Fukatsuia symbiotica]